MTVNQRGRIGLALGSGSARGWAHIGVIRALREAGIEPEVVAGTSIGALVGGAYAAGELDRLDAWVRTLSWGGVVKFFDVSLRHGGMIKGEKLLNFFQRSVVDMDIDSLVRPFGAVATDMASGREVWFRRGSLYEAVRASISLPGVISPALRDGRWMLDGGVVNPVPVSLCYALGADRVIAVNLNRDLVGRAYYPGDHAGAPRALEEAGTGEAAGGDEAQKTDDNLLSRITDMWSEVTAPSKEAATPGMLEVMASSINIMQDRVTRSRMAGDPPDVLLAPRLGSFRMLEFYRAEEAIEEGENAVQKALPQLKAMFGEDGD